MKRYILRLSFILFAFFYYNAQAQVFTFKADGKFMSGKITEAVVVNLGETDYL